MYTKHKWESDVHFNFSYALNLPRITTKRKNTLSLCFCTERVR